MSDLIIGVCPKCGKPMCECNLSFEDKHNLKTPVWPEKGSLPPVGTECEAICNSDSNPEWFEIQYLGEREGRPMFFDIERKEATWAGSPIYEFEFRPIKTEREKVVEAVITKFNEFIPPAVVEKLYDIGALRMPEDD